MLDSQMKLVIGIIRSKPFLLFVILVLSGIIYIHLSSPEINVSLVARPQKRPTDGILQFEKKGLITDVIEEVVLNTILNKGEYNVESNDSAGKQIESVGTGRNCSKQINVSFLKVHKAGSTTLMNIFLRFAISNQLNIVLPPKSNGFGFNYLGYGKTVSRDQIVPLPNNETYNILCNHVVYNKEAFHSIMPKDTVYVGILREPTSHFRSAASYYGFYNHLKNKAKEKGLPLGVPVISEFLKNPSDFNVGTYFVYNRMSFDFGIPKSQFHNASFVDEYIRDLDRDYGLVMVMEKFQESLVLLKRLLCWHTKDILYVPLNARKKTNDISLTAEDMSRLKTWNNADYKLYNHFNSVFEHRIKYEGTDFLDEVESFKTIQDTVKEFCKSKQPSLQNLSIPETNWDDSFNVTKVDCKLMTEDELPMMKRLIEAAWRRVNTSNTSESKKPGKVNGCDTGICF